jgi:hypothetical protein
VTVKAAQKTISLNRRQQIVANFSWVTYCKEGQPCDALIRPPLKVLFPRPGKLPIDPTPWRCKKTAHWRFRALRRSLAKDGIYCWVHINCAGLFACPGEETRTIRELNKVVEWPAKPVT